MSDSVDIHDALGTALPVYGAVSKIAEGVAEKCGVDKSDAKIIAGVAGAAASVAAVVIIGSP